MGRSGTCEKARYCIVSRDMKVPPRVQSSHQMVITLFLAVQMSMYVCNICRYYVSMSLYIYAA
jgi:hypothetical protein